MNMNKAFFLPTESRDPKWLEVDAKGQVLGRLATRIANALRGKNKPYYTPHTDCGDYVIVTNAKEVVLTGNKLADKIYEKYTGYIGGLKQKTAETLMKEAPEKIIEFAVKGMLPKNRLNDKIIKKLKVYPSDKHPHGAHLPQKLK
jgi:large subunit ribosomal protein L13